MSGRRLPKVLQDARLPRKTLERVPSYSCEGEKMEKEERLDKRNGEEAILENEAKSAEAKKERNHECPYPGCLKILLA